VEIVTDDEDEGIFAVQPPLRLRPGEKGQDTEASGNRGLFTCCLISPSWIQFMSSIIALTQLNEDPKSFNSKQISLHGFRFASKCSKLSFPVFGPYSATVWVIIPRSGIA